MTQQFCNDPRHDTPCPLPCDACMIECCRGRNRFNVTYEIITDESAEHGDAEERGYIVENVSLRDAIVAVGNTRTDCVCGSSVEADTCAPGVPRWITVFNGMEYETGAYESRSLHIPDNVTASSAIRIARYLGAYTYARKGR